MEQASVRYAEILDRIAFHKSGISFNKLADELKGHISRAVLSRSIKELSSMGYIEPKRDASHRQRIIFRLNEDLTLLVNKTRPKSPAGRLTRRRACRIVLKYISVYDELAGRVRSSFLREYLKHRITMNFSNLLEVIR